MPFLTLVPKNIASLKNSMWILKKSVKHSNFQKRQGKGWRIATLLALFVQISFSRPKVRRKTLTGSVRAEFENPLPSLVRLRPPFLMEIISVPLNWYPHGEI